MVGQCFCDDSSCECHTNKGEYTCHGTGGGSGNCKHFPAPTQPESSWEERFDNEFPAMGVSDKESDSIYRHDQYKNNKSLLKKFIRTEIEAAEARGIDIGGKTQGGTGRFMYEKGQQDVIDEIKTLLEDEGLSKNAVLDLLTSLRKEV